MRAAWVPGMLLLAACARQSPSGSSPVPSAAVATSRPACPPQADSLPPPLVINRRASAYARNMDSAADLVDTLLVLHPDSILVKVGQSVNQIDSVRVEGRRSSGEPLDFPKFIDILDRSVAQTDVTHITGLRAGRTYLVIRVMSRVARARPACVPVRVVP